MHHHCEPGELGPLAQIPLKTEPGPSCWKLTGDPGSVFQGNLSPEVLKQVPTLHGTSSLASGSGCDLSHLLAPALLCGEGGSDLPSSGEVALTLGKVSCEFHYDCLTPSGSYPWSVCQDP